MANKFWNSKFKIVDANQQHWEREGQIFLRLHGLIWRQFIGIIFPLGLNALFPAVVQDRSLLQIIAGTIKFAMWCSIHDLYNAKLKQWGFALRSCYWLLCLTLTSRDRCEGSVTCRVNSTQELLSYFSGQMKDDRTALDCVDNIDTEQTFTSSKDVKENEDNLSL